MIKAKKHEKVIGAGPEWTEHLEIDILEKGCDLSCIEIIPENFINNPQREGFLNSLKKHNTPVLVHSVGLSLASDEPLKEAHLENILRVQDKVNAINLSDHLSFTEAQGIEIGQLTPIPFSQKCADIVSNKIELIQKRIKIPFLLEHVAYRFFYKNNELTEPQLINKILDRTGCGFLLDLHNLYCNSLNNHYDPIDWLNEIRLDKVASIHLAGGYQASYGAYLDGHSNPVPEGVWDLLTYVLTKITPETIIVERTSNYPGFLEMMAEVKRAENLLNAYVKETEKNIKYLEISL